MKSSAYKPLGSGQRSLWNQWQEARFKLYTVVVAGLIAAFITPHVDSFGLTNALGIPVALGVSAIWGGSTAYVGFAIALPLLWRGDEETFDRGIAMSAVAFLAFGVIVGMTWILLLLMEVRGSVWGARITVVWTTSMLGGLIVMLRWVMYFHYRNVPALPH